MICDQRLAELSDPFIGQGREEEAFSLGLPEKTLAGEQVSGLLIVRGFQGQVRVTPLVQSG